MKQSRTIMGREGWYYLAVLIVLFLGALLRDINLLLLLAGLLTGPLLLGWRLVVLNLRGIEVTRRMPRGVCAGDPWVVGVDVTLKRRRMSAWALVVEDRIRRVGRGTRGMTVRPAVYFTHVPPQSTSSKDYRGRLPERGRYTLGPMRLSTRFPFGLFTRTITFGHRDTVTVFPRQGRLTSAWRTRQHDAFDGTQRRQMRHSRVSGDLYGVREWRSGDSRRWIHWRSSAKHGELVVRQFEQQRNRDAAVLVDLWQPEKPTPRDLENIELAVSFAATVVADACRRGGTNLLVATANGKPEFTDGPVSIPLLEEAMGQLAMAEPSSKDYLHEMLHSVLQTVEPGAEVVVVGTRNIDLSDKSRFGDLWDDPATRASVRQIRLVDTSDESLSEIFLAR